MKNPTEHPIPEQVPVAMSIRPMVEKVTATSGGLHESVRELLSGLAHSDNEQSVEIHSLAPLFSDDECLVIWIHPEKIEQLQIECPKRGLLCERLDQLVDACELPSVMAGGDDPGASVSQEPVAEDQDFKDVDDSRSRGTGSPATDGATQSGSAE